MVKRTVCVHRNECMCVRVSVLCSQKKSSFSKKFWVFQNYPRKENLPLIHDFSSIPHAAAASHGGATKEPAPAIPCSSHLPLALLRHLLPVRVPGPPGACRSSAWARRWATRRLSSCAAPAPCSPALGLCSSTTPCRSDLDPLICLHRV